MKFRIEYINNKHCDLCKNSTDLIATLRHLDGQTVADVRKIYKSGVTDSVLDKYRQYIVD